MSLLLAIIKGQIGLFFVVLDVERGLGWMLTNKHVTEKKGAKNNDRGDFDFWYMGPFVE